MSSVFDRFPSAQDLLSRPVLRRLTQSLDRQIVVGRVKQYLGELKAQVEQASEGKLPSITGLAERIARWIAEREQLGPRVVINATGNLFHSDLVHAPMAESACAAMVSASLSGVYANDSAKAALLSTEERLARLLGAEAALVGSSLSASLSLVFAARFADRRVLIRRGDVVELNDGLRLSELAAAHRVDLAEVGASNLVRIDDFTQALQTDASAWLRIGADTPAATSQPIDIAAVRSQSNQDFSVVEVLTHAAVTDWTDFGLPMLPVVGQRLQAGVDLVVFSGDRWLSGPAVGIVAGSKKLVEELKQSVDRFASSVDPIRVAGLEAALRMYDDPAAVAEKHPLLSLLNASLENLKNRAQRMAPQLAALAGVAECLVIEGDAVQTPLPEQSLSVPSYRLKIIPQNMTVEEIREQLATHPQFSILPVASEQELLFDLRSIHPRYDAELIARISEVFVNGGQAVE